MHDSISFYSHIGLFILFLFVLPNIAYNRLMKHCWPIVLYAHWVNLVHIYYINLSLIILIMFAGRYRLGTGIKYTSSNCLSQNFEFERYAYVWEICVVYVCMGVCVCVCMYICLCLNMYIYIYLCIYLCVYIDMMYLYICVYQLYTCMYM